MCIYTVIFICLIYLSMYVCVCLFVVPGFGGLDMGFQKGCYQQGPDSDSPGCC